MCEYVCAASFQRSPVCVYMYVLVCDKLADTMLSSTFDSVRV